jgi:hypothetical protein
VKRQGQSSVAAAEVVRCKRWFPGKSDVSIPDPAVVADDRFAASTDPLQLLDRPHALPRRREEPEINTAVAFAELDSVNLKIVDDAGARPVLIMRQRGLDAATSSCRESNSSCSISRSKSRGVRFFRKWMWFPVVIMHPLPLERAAFLDVTIIVRRDRHQRRQK